MQADPIPQSFRSLGFDSVNNSMESTLKFECSPLSCNYRPGFMRPHGCPSVSCSVSPYWRLDVLVVVPFMGL